MPALMIVLAATLWGLIGPAAIFATAAGLPPLALAFWRALLAAVLFALIARTALLRIRGGDMIGVLAFGIIGIAVMYAAFFQSVRYNGAPLAAILLYTGPIWVALFEAVRKRKLPDPPTLFALTLAVAGVVTVSWTPDAASSDIAIGWGLLSGLAFAMHFVIAPRYLARYGAAPVYGIAMLAGALVLIPFTGVAAPPAAAWPYVLYVGAGATFAASYFFAAGVVRIAATRAAVLSTIEPVVATVASIVFLAARPSLQHLAGALLILSGVLISVGRPDP